MDTVTSNPITKLLEQAIILIEASSPVKVIVDHEAITKAAIHAAQEERKRMIADPRILVTQSEAHSMYGKSVITSLVKSEHLQQYKFGLREVLDSEGDLVKKTKGVVYYRIVDIEKAIEEGNMLKGIRKLLG